MCRHPLRKGKRFWLKVGSSVGEFEVSIAFIAHVLIVGGVGSMYLVVCADPFSSRTNMRFNLLIYECLDQILV